MLYNFTFEEAMKVLYNEEGWVQGERFGKNTYIAYDKKRGLFCIKCCKCRRPCRSKVK